MMYEKIIPPETGEVITFQNGEPVVPDNPIIPFIRGDGTGIDLWPASQRVFDAAVETAYGGKRKISWFMPGMKRVICMAPISTFQKIR